jgi:Zn-dependent oligopeptidase
MNNNYRMQTLILVLAATFSTSLCAAPSENPMFAKMNEPIDFASLTAAHVTEYSDAVLEQVDAQAEAIRRVDEPSFDNIIIPLDRIYRDLSVASNHTWLMYWVSPDADTRDAGLEAYKQLDSWSVSLYSDKEIYNQIVAVANSTKLTGVSHKLVADLLTDMQHTGVNLDPKELEQFVALTDEINDLKTEYSSNMNSDTSVLTLDEDGIAGLPENFKGRYATEDGGYAVPVISANRSPVLNNAESEETRRAFSVLYANRAQDKNLSILDELVSKRHEKGTLMGHATYADYHLESNMANTPHLVWDFLEDLTTRSAEKAQKDLNRLTDYRNDNFDVAADTALNPWDVSFYRNSILKTEYGVDQEKIREYLPLAGALTGMMDFYQELLDLEFRVVESPSVWHEEVEMYEVYMNGKLTGRFYLDLFPRPNKESWFYAVSMTPGNARDEGYEIPVSMMLGNFTRPTEDLPALISHRELDTLFHEFGHVMSSMSFNGPYAMQNGSRADFGEAMSQIFENWTLDYDVLKTFAIHYETGEVLPEETLRKMVEAKTITSGLSAQSSIEKSMYDMTLYNRYDPNEPLDTDEIWRSLGDEMAFSYYVEGTHPQASWIHINTHPCYYYGYLWSEVYAQDMYTVFEENGLRDTETGVRYRDIILANGTQRPIEEAVEEFLGRASNNEAYIESLGLE